MVNVENNFQKLSGPFDTSRLRADGFFITDR